MAYVHSSVNDISTSYLINEKRYNYTTPKSFLEQINLYGKLLTTKKNELAGMIERLQSGLEKLKSCGEQASHRIIYKNDIKFYEMENTLKF